MDSRQIEKKWEFELRPLNKSDIKPLEIKSLGLCDTPQIMSAQGLSHSRLGMLVYLKPGKFVFRIYGANRLHSETPLNGLVFYHYSHVYYVNGKIIGQSGSQGKTTSIWEEESGNVCGEVKDLDLNHATLQIVDENKFVALCDGNYPGRAGSVPKEARLYQFSPELKLTDSFSTMDNLHFANQANSRPFDHVSLSGQGCLVKNVYSSSGFKFELYNIVNSKYSCVEYGFDPFLMPNNASVLQQVFPLTANLLFLTYHGDPNYFAHVIWNLKDGTYVFASQPPHLEHTCLRVLPDQSGFFSLGKQYNKGLETLRNNDIFYWDMKNLHHPVPLNLNRKITSFDLLGDGDLLLEKRDCHHGAWPREYERVKNPLVMRSERVSTVGMFKPRISICDAITHILKKTFS